jgi:CRISPR/Cas system-associated exonuclease Cas4 (RecB family)
MKKIIIRPSSIASFVSCPRQWYNVFILGHNTIPNVRAVIGTGIHAGAEALWKEAIKTKDKSNPNMSMVNDAAIEAYDEEAKLGNLQYEEDVDDNIARATILKGTKAFIEDIVPYTKIPINVETRVTVDINHCMVKGISGTIDYISRDTIADIKTSKRKIVPQSHQIQQSIYTYLAENNGYNIKNTLIQGVVLAKTKTVGGIDRLQTNIRQAKYIVNNLLDRLDALHAGVDPDMLFPGNPKHYLCSDRYCNLRPSCPFVHGIK